MGYEQDFETPLLCLDAMSLVMLIFIFILENILVSDSCLPLSFSFCGSLFVFISIFKLIFHGRYLTL